MCETYKCETFINSGEENYRIAYYLVTEDYEHYGIKSTLYEDQQLKTTTLLILALDRDAVEQIIYEFCEQHVLPSSYRDILMDSGIHIC